MILNYESSTAYIETIDDENLQKLMRAVVATVTMDKELGAISSEDDFDLLSILKFVNIFFRKKHVLEAYASSDWSSLTWWDDK